MKTIDEIMNNQLKILSELESLRNQVESIEQSGNGLVGIDAAAKILNISKGTLYRWTSASIVPYYKPRGKTLYFAVNELLEWVKDKDQKRNSISLNVEEIDKSMLDQLK